MVRFPETVQREWEAVAEAEQARIDLHKRLKHATSVEAEVERLRVRHEATQQFQSELDAESAPALEMFTLAEYQNDPEATPADLIDGVMREHGVTLVMGPSGTGKTTIALQMVYSLMTGEPWLGQPVTKVSGGAGLLSYDMHASQMADWMSGFPNLDTDKISVVNAYRQGNPLGVKEFRARITEEWKNLGVEIIVVDSFSASFFGRDQNDAAETMGYYRDMKQFAFTEVGARVLIVIAHSTENAPTKVRGSSVHKDTADNLVVVLKDGESGKRTVYSDKYREIRGGPQQMSPVIVTAPDPVTHLVDVDTGAMSLAGLPIPEGVGDDLFTDLPEPHEEPLEADEDESESEDW